MVVDDLSRMVAFETVSAQPVAPLADWLAERLERLGMTVRDVADPEHPGKRNLVATAGPEGTDGIVLTGHMDVVPTEGQPWTSDPFVVTRRGDRLYGRGTADMKGFIAATLAALARIDLGRLQRELMLIWTYDEEVGCLGSAHLVDTFKREGRPVPSACLVGEPTSFRILRMHAGHVAVRIAVRGEAAHSSRPDLGVNAIEGAARMVEVVRQLAREEAGSPRDIPELERPWTAINVGRIHGGSAVNIVPDACTLDVGYRPLPGEPHLGILDELTRRAAAIGGPWQFDVSLLHGIVSLSTAPDTPLQALLASWAAHPDVGAAAFATDGGNLAQLGTAPLVFGPGSIDVAHKADEYVEVGALHRAVDVVESVVRARCLPGR
jgi:acetylornithine deacetylase